MSELQVKNTNKRLIALEKKVRELSYLVTKQQKAIPVIEKRLKMFKPSYVEEQLKAFEDRAREVGDLIQVMVTRTAVATELSFYAKKAGSEVGSLINQDVVYALDLPFSFWEQHKNSSMTISEWIGKLRQMRIADQKRAA